MKKDFDNQFEKIDGLKWKPWVGSSYDINNSKNRILIIGESHYYSSERTEEHDAPTFTREIVEDLAIDRNYYDTNFFQNLHKVLFLNDDFEADKFWNLISFYNFVQEPMDTSKGRPTYHQFFSGWQVFCEVIEVLEPTVCLFLGVEASNTLEDAFPDSEWEVTAPVKEDKIGRTSARYATAINQNGRKVELIFIQHPSHHFSWESWNKYLSKKMSKPIEWLHEGLKEAE